MSSRIGMKMSVWPILAMEMKKQSPASNSKTVLNIIQFSVSPLRYKLQVYTSIIISFLYANTHILVFIAECHIKLIYNDMF
jgi:hypothetical protein